MEPPVAPSIRAFLWGWILILGFLLLGCDRPEATAPYFPAAPTPPPTLTPVTWQRVVSGDTIDVLVSADTPLGDHNPLATVSPGQQVRIRLIGIDAPSRQEPWGQAAQAQLETLLRGEAKPGQPPTKIPLGLEWERQTQDQYDRYLAYGWVDNTLLNQALVREGYALSRSYFPNLRYEIPLEDAQQEARLLEKGLWGSESVAVE